MALITALKQRVATRALTQATSNGSLDLRKLKVMPPVTRLPMRRDAVDPVPKLMDLQRSEPVTRLMQAFGMNIWLVTGYEEAKAVLADGDGFSNDLGRFVSTDGREGKDQIGGLGMIDPPLHTTMRRYLTPEFTMRRLARLQPTIDRIVAERLDAMAAAGPEVDLVSEFAFPIPFEVICDLLGLPVDDRAHFHSLGAARFDLTEGGVGSFGAASASRDFLIQSVVQQRAHPGEGLIGGLLAAHGSELDDVALGGLADGVFLGGYETSASMLSLGTYLLAKNPEAMRLMRGSPEEVDAVVEEMLRHIAVVQLAFIRFARHDMVIGGQQIKDGDPVGVSLLAANRDPSLVGDDDTFNPRREPIRHLSFGHGMHRCVGAELARMELRSALRGLAERFPDITVTAPDKRLPFRKLSAVYGVDALPVDLYGSPGVQRFQVLGGLRRLIARSG